MHGGASPPTPSPQPLGPALATSDSGHRTVFLITRHLSLPFAAPTSPFGESQTPKSMVWANPPLTSSGWMPILGK